jgi:hypothetical protein
VPHRPLALVSGLTVGDYLLWNWSLSGNHEVLALVAGLTLPPLAVACVWLLVLSAARLIADLARRSPTRRSAARNAPLGRGKVTGDGRARPERKRAAQASAGAPEKARSAAGSPDPPSRTLAA